jgi:hypothetical protein
MNVNTLLEGSNPYSAYSSEANRLAKKWAKSGLLEGADLKSEVERNNMAIILENQAKQLVQEASATGQGTSITTGNSEAWAGVALPLVRRVFGEIVAKDLVSVQPMNLPSGLLFYLDFQYGSNTLNHTSGESIYGATADMTKTNLTLGAGGVRNVNGSDEVDGRGKGLYGAGQYGYSINSASTSVTLTGASSGAAAFNGILNYDSLFSASFAGLFGGASGATSEIRVLRVPISSLTASLVNGQTGTFDEEAVKTFTINNSNISASFPQFTRVNGGNIEFVVSAAAAAAVASTTIGFVTKPDNLNDRGDFEDSIPATTVSSQKIPEINIQMRSSTVTAKTRKLKAQWTPEFAQDLNAYHSIDAEAELTSVLSEYISMEIDLEILDMLITSADTTDAWNVKIGVTADGTAEADSSTQYYTRMSWFQTLGIKLQKVSNIIHQKTLRGGANFMVVSPKVSTILESIPGFAADSAGDASKYNMGVQKIGAINNRYTVYKNPYMLENTILMGYKGNQFLETGAVFAPYIPLIMTPLVYDPISFTPKKGIMTRYAKKMVRPDFYGKIEIAGLDLL